MTNEEKVPDPAVAKPTTSAATGPITFEQFTESAMAAVLRAVKANKLPHAPIIIGVIWHPGLVSPILGFGGYGTQQPTCGFEKTVKPFFTDCYRTHMMSMFDLYDPNAVKQNWQAIYDAVHNGSMPAPGCPGTFNEAGFLLAFQCWKDQGFPP